MTHCDMYKNNKFKFLKIERNLDYMTAQIVITLQVLLVVVPSRKTSFNVKSSIVISNSILATG